MKCANETVTIELKNGWHYLFSLLQHLFIAFLEYTLLELPSESERIKEKSKTNMFTHRNNPPRHHSRSQPTDEHGPALRENDT